jgi:muramoyltetrapeptide carboxypeptidase
LADHAGRQRRPDSVFQEETVALTPVIHRPLPLRPGQTIAVVAPASAPRDVHKLLGGILHLKDRGFDVEVGRAAYAPHGYLCGTDAERLDEFNAFLRRPDVAALFCVRGGYGALRLLPHLDYAAARRHPKLLVGYSDITALHLALYQHAGWTGLSGPMVAVEWDALGEQTERLFWELAHGGTPGPLLGPGGETLQPVRTGSAEGVLLGGNLSMVTRLVGTPYLPDLEGALLFVEDVGEAPYRIDALFAQLRLAGLLDRLGGLVLGAFTEATPLPDRPSLTVEEVLDDYVGSLPYPVASGLVYGHFPVKNTLPIGVRARLKVTSHAATLSLLEPVVA